jgi:hypothetical protein
MGIAGPATSHAVMEPVRSGKTRFRQLMTLGPLMELAAAARGRNGSSVRRRAYRADGLAAFSLAPWLASWALSAEAFLASRWASSRA